MKTFNIKTFKMKLLLFAHEHGPIMAILAFALGMEMYYMFSTPKPELIYDAHNYDTMAKQFLDKGVLGYQSTSPNAFTTPGYPLFLALIYKIFGYSDGSPLTAVRIIQIFMAVATIWFLYLLAKYITNKRVGLIAAFMCSIYLVFLWVPTLILTETLYTFLFILYLYLQIRAIKEKSIKMNFATGLVFAAAVLVRPAVAPLIVLPYIYYYFAEKKDKWLFKGLLANIVGFVILMMPWWIRNIASLKKFVLFATQEDPLLRGTYPYEIGVENMPLTNQTHEAIKRLIDGFTTQPLLYLKWYTLGKFDYLYFKIFYYVDDSVGTLRWLLPLHNLYVWFGWVGVALGAVKKEIRLISLYIIFITLISLVFVATSRYAYPVMYLLIFLTAYIFEALFRKQKGTGRKALENK